ncbi:GNAT family N-acetyltransferase [Hazenella sp. IB182357]|uniref:GNAT family N-acetyltransferase n=1 Tax=Polycladospora coralii TaxID=2771432 RepID=A0A926NAL3_9BACL|nr:GNAT family N-acetyltransferase [Polycladospora coralii]MBD1372100.1 GNAT family N-acetyltransferase [Polycladospora coralii]MBS7530606.1 GNAT family N-acetyltransferase [Polycladospora coralii]
MQATTNRMEFVQAKETQIDELIQIYKQNVRLMNERGIYQWNEDYPDREELMQDIKCGEMFLLTIDGDIAGAVALNELYDLEYNEIEWKDESGKFLVVHRFCVNTKFQGQGISKTLLKHIDRYAKQTGYASIRLDTMMANEIAMNLYQKDGYEARGQFFFPGLENPFMAFEKHL